MGTGNPYELIVNRLRRIRQTIGEIRNASKSSGTAQAKAKTLIVRETMREIDLNILPSIRAVRDPIAFVLPTSIEWIGWEALRITDTEEEFMEHVLDLSHAGLDDALLLLLGMLGPHIRQQSDEVDCAILPLLLATAFRRLDSAFESGKLISAETIAGIIFNAIHFNPDYSLSQHRAGQRQPYDFAVYQKWSSLCFNEIGRMVPSIDVPALVETIVKLFPLLLGARGTQLPLPLQFADKSRNYMEQGGQDLLELFVQYLERLKIGPTERDFPTVWKFVSGSSNSAVLDFMRSRNHRMPTFQLELLTRIRDNLLQGTLLLGNGNSKR
jgi:hypothetical protein